MAEDRGTPARDHPSDSRRVRRDDEVDEVRTSLGEALGDDFEILRFLGRGRMGLVFMAREKALQRLVAIKVLRPDLAMEEAPRKRFLREGRSAASIGNPHVVKVHRVGSTGDGTPYQVMEYIDGRTMDAILAGEGPQGETEVRRILCDVAGALQAAHDQDIVHRDVRPENIMQERQADRYVLTDFGVAGILESRGEAITRLTGAGEILGKVRYTAPELFRGESARRESDVYALAVTAYELLTGRGPYDAERTADVVQAHLSGEPRPIRELAPRVGKDLEQLLLRCLAKTPSHRPRAGDIVKRLQAGSDGDGGEADDAGERGALSEFLRELQRRHVYKVGAGYAAFAFITIEASGNVLDAFETPGWVYRLIVAVVLGGFPFTLVLAWVYDITSRGIERTAGESAPSRWTRTIQILALGASLIFAVAVGWFILR